MKISDWWTPVQNETYDGTFYSYCTATIFPTSTGSHYHIFIRCLVLRCSKSIYTVRIAVGKRKYIKKSVPELELGTNQFQKLYPLYGLCDSGDMLYSKIDLHHQMKLGMTPTRLDPTLYYRSYNGEMLGLTAIYVEDILLFDHEEFN